ncbi:MAG: hypothetical protein RJQ09_06770 [Cyclobacteriaceae bacterium]
MSDYNDKQQVVLEYLDAVSLEKTESLRLLISHNAVFEFPYALPGKPKILNGRDKIIQHLIKQPFKSTFLEPIQFQVTLSGLLIAEIHSKETFNETFKIYNQHLICTVSVVDGQIEHYKEIFNPILRLEGLLNLEKD